jgi:hypothetical protein
MNRELIELRRELARVERGRGRRYPEQLRVRVTQWTRVQRQRGASWKAIGRELKIAPESLRRWTLAALQREPELVPVEVVADADDEAAGHGQRLRVVTRVGHRIEGLSLADVVELVRVLG